MPKPGSAECPACGETKSAPFFERDEVSLRRCGACRHAFTDLGTLAHRPVYDAAYYEEAHKNWFLHPNRRLFDRIASEVTSRGEVRSLLDVGCGRGNFLRHYRDRHPGTRLVGVDLAAADLGERIEWVKGDINDPHIAPERFDVVVSLAVIEHIADPLAYLRAIDERLAPGGVLCLTTVNEASVLYGVARLLRFFGVPGPLVRLYDPHHVNHFRPSSLRRLLERAGFRVERSLRHNIPLAAVDLPYRGRLARAVATAGITTLFALGWVCRATFLETVLCERRAP